jgi:Arc/MetJ-type ribon-helix-helix transcriptional regulator
MTLMNVSLPEEPKAYVDLRLDHDGYSSVSEYVRMLIRQVLRLARVTASGHAIACLRASGGVQSLFDHRLCKKYDKAAP